MPERDRWKTIERIYHEAIELPVPERNAFLESACADDPTLRQELQSLLATDGLSFLDKSALEVAAAEMAPDMTSSWIGQRIRGYEILALIGAGGMGEVYRARDTSLERDVALKFLPREVAANPDLLTRLQREARLLASLNHPRIATVHGLEESDGSRFLVMEFVPGQTLAARLHNGAPPLREALDISRQIAEGIEAAHEAGIVHRDLKPANIKVAPDGRVKLLDFGLAKALAPTSPTELTPQADTATREGTVLGTAAYMSPEQARGQPVDRRTDIWAFGCCVYECLSGRAAFTGATITDTLAAILDREPDWNALGVRIPRRIRRLLRRCLAKDVGKRLQHIGDARLELEETEDDDGDGRLEAHGWTVPSGPALLGAALLIAATAALAYGLFRERAPATSNPPVARLTLNLQGDLPADTELQVHRFFVPFALSPDGQRVVFRARNATASQLFLRELSGFDVKALQGTERATTPFFSPDGRWVGFWRAEDRTLRKVSIAGGSPIEIGQTDTPIHALWESDGEILFEAGSSGRELWSIAASGGKPQEIVVHDRSEGERISLRARVPGGNDLLVSTRGPAGNWLQLLSRETGRRRRVLSGGSNVLAHYTRTRHLLYSDRDALFAVPLDRRFEPLGAAVPVIHGIDHWYWHSNVAVSMTGTVAYLPADRVREAELVWLGDGARSTPVASGRGSFTSVTLSPDGREAAADLVDNAKSQVWIVDLERGTKRLLDSEGDSPIWSRDGTFITYASRRNRGDAFYRARADGTGTREYLITRPGGYPTPSDSSPDGRTVLFSEFTERGDSDLWVYSDGKATRFLGSAFSEHSAKFSRDGRFVAYAADDGGVSHVYVQPFPGPGPRAAVSAEESGMPHWSTDGDSLFFKSGQRIMMVPVQTSPVLRIGEPKVWIDAGRPFGDYALPHAGRRLLTLSDRATESPLELRLILNWFEELNRLVPHP